VYIANASDDFMERSASGIPFSMLIHLMSSCSKSGFNLPKSDLMAAVVFNF
jgi:hypothetical protein